VAPFDCGIKVVRRLQSSRKSEGQSPNSFVGVSKAFRQRHCRAL
jgi:hypothetical protein